jgi:hypothetical protein
MLDGARSCKAFHLTTDRADHTHIYSKLGLASRVQLVQEAMRRMKRQRGSGDL